MARITQQDIDEMRERGYDAATIAQARIEQSRSKEADDICDEIKAAFAGVVLGGGVGLWQAQGLDDYEDEATCLSYRERDEKDDWLAITYHALVCCNSSPSFFDAEGFRFHLPAFMIADLQDKYGFDFIYSLINFQHLKHERYALLSPSQRRSVRNYLLWHCDDVHNDFDRPDIEKALNTYWTEASCQPQQKEAEQGGDGDAEETV